MNTAPNAGIDLRNPIIADTTADTLFQVGCCLAFIGKVHSDLADWEVLAQSGAVVGPDTLSWEQHRGLSLLTDCVRSAVLYELERV